MSEQNKNSTEGATTVNKALTLIAAMVQEKNAKEILHYGLSLCISVLESQRGLLIAETHRGTYRLVEQHGDEHSNAFSKTALRLVREKKEPLLISDTFEDDELGAQASIRGNEIRSVLCSQLIDSSGNETEESVYLYLDSTTSTHPFSMEDLDRFRLLSQIMKGLVENTEVLAQQEAQIEDLNSRVTEQQYEDLIFGSTTFKKTIALVKQAAPTEVPILLNGETGTGKEVLAKLIHKLSNRSEKPFIAVNCGAIPPNLLESQLFGHEKGAFTGAISMQKGFFEEASGGTLFLDEIGELPLAMQPGFLRAIQEQEIMRVGSSKTIAVDVRIVAATNVDLEHAVAENTFRSDLYYRLSVFPVVVPPVRERGEDALLLARFFLKKFAGSIGKDQVTLSREAEKSLLRYNWPGNVREIQNKIQRAVITAFDGVIREEHLAIDTDKSAEITNLRDAREALDRELIEKALKRSPGNLTNAAKILGIDRKSLRLLLEKYNLQRD